MISSFIELKQLFLFYSIVIILLWINLRQFLPVSHNQVNLNDILMHKNCNLKWVPAGFKSVHCPISLDMHFRGKSLLLSIELMESDEKEMIKPQLS